MGLERNYVFETVFNRNDVKNLLWDIVDEIPKGRVTFHPCPEEELLPGRKSEFGQEAISGIITQDRNLIRYSCPVPAVADRGEDAIERNAYYGIKFTGDAETLMNSIHEYLSKRNDLELKE